MNNQTTIKGVPYSIIRRLIISRCTRFKSRYVDFDQLYSIAIFAMLAAAESYEPGPAKFTTFAVICIDNAFRTAITKARRDHDCKVMVSNHLIGAYSKLRGGFSSSVINICSVEKAIDDLDGITKKVITQRFGLDRSEPQTLHEVASNLKCSHESVRRYQESGFGELRKKLA